MTPFVAVNGSGYLPDATYFDGVDAQANVPLVPFGSRHVPEQFESAEAAVRHGEWWAARGEGRPRDGWQGVPIGEFSVEYEPD